MNRILNIVLSLIVLVNLLSCDGGIEVEVWSMENNSVDGLFKSDTVLDGTPIAGVDFEIMVAASDGVPGMHYTFTTDSSGVYRNGYVIPPMKTYDYFKGYLTWSKDGYIIDTIFFNHSSVDKRIAIINMIKNK